MGQVWSKANFDGTNSTNHLGGRGSVLAVTAQNPNTPAPLNYRPVSVSFDFSTDDSCNNPNDRVRNFTSMHPGGVHFLFADGAVRFLTEGMDQQLYEGFSTIRGSENVEEF